MPPYQNQLDAGGLPVALKSDDIAFGQGSSFFTETSAETLKAFADVHGISADELADVAGKFQNWSVQAVALVA